MRGIVVLTAALAAATAHAGPATVRLAQTSAVTNCMMTCNAQAATCQTTCLVPTTPTGSVTAAATGNATLNTVCQANCTTQQISCQTTCARNSPSQ